MQPSVSLFRVFFFPPKWHPACPDHAPSQGSGKREMITPMVGWSASLKRIWLVSSLLLKMARDCCCKGVQSGERGFRGVRSSYLLAGSIQMGKLR